MSQKNIAFFQESQSDRVVSIDSQNYGGTIAIATFPSIYPTFWLQADDDGVFDLCTNIDDSITTISAIFKRSDDSTYTIISCDFIGPRPKRRPH